MSRGHENSYSCALLHTYTSCMNASLYTSIDQDFISRIACSACERVGLPLVFSVPKMSILSRSVHLFGVFVVFCSFFLTAACKTFENFQ